jgi:hypothetical protein
MVRVGDTLTELFDLIPPNGQPHPIRKFYFELVTGTIDPFPLLERANQFRSIISVSFLQISEHSELCSSRGIVPQHLLISSYEDLAQVIREVRPLNI